MFGESFKAAQKAWLYPSEKHQGFWRSVGLFVMLFLAFQILQLALAVVIFRFGFGEPLSNLATDPVGFAKSAIVGMFPASLPIMALAIYTAKFGLPNRMGSLPLHWPRLGWLGWFIVLFGFLVLMAVSMNLIYWMTGFDPSKGTGVVEETMAELTRNPLVFSLSLPSVILAAPLVEEFLFRGILFSGLVNTPLGRVGAVVVTSALWALAHAFGAPWINVGMIFVMGLLLGFLLLRFGSLWVTIACHTAWNTMTSLAIFVIGSHS